ncbi:MAG: response regulator [Caldilineaceae bacterium]
MLVDDHAVVRSGLAAPSWHLTIWNWWAKPRRRGGCSHAPVPFSDVVLMDLVMPEMDGATATKPSAGHPEIQVIVLTSFKEDDLRICAQAGAIGYLLKNVSTSDLADAIRAAYAGRADAGARGGPGHPQPRATPRRRTGARPDRARSARCSASWSRVSTTRTSRRTVGGQPFHGEVPRGATSSKPT